MVLLRNSDGHVSELRCALPILLLSRTMIEEARLASSGARNLLFGPSGALLPESSGASQQTELPAYAEHVYDRVPYADQQASEYRPNPWASHNSSPATTPAPSRPGSPVAGQSSIGANVAEEQTPQPASTIDLPPHSTSPHDNDLMKSRPPATPSSANSNSFRRLTHRTKSTSSSTTSNDSPAPSPALSTGSSHSTSSLTGFFGHLHLPKPLRPLTSLSRHSTQDGRQAASSDSLYSLNIPVASSSSSEPISPAHSNPPSRPSSPRFAHQAGFSEVPTYEHTISHNHGGGVVPLSSLMGLPDYSPECETPHCLKHSKDPMKTA